MATIQVTKREISPAKVWNKTGPDKRYELVDGFSGIIQFAHQKKPREISAPTEAEVNQKLDVYIAQEQLEKDQALARIAERKARRALQASEAAKTIKVGDIFYSSWGYDQTNIDFYQVTKVSAKTAEIRPIAGSEVPGARYEPGSSSQVTAAKDSFTGPAEKHLIQSYDGKPYFHLTSYSSASAWDGNPKSYSWGH